MNDPVHYYANIILETLLLATEDKTLKTVEEVFGLFGDLVES